jgi:hypothetical protein
MFRYVFNWTPFTSKSMHRFRLNDLRSLHLLQFKSVFQQQHRLVNIPPMKLLVSSPQNYFPPPLNPETNYSFLVALCFGVLVIFSRK